MNQIIILYKADDKVTRYKLFLHDGSIKPVVYPEVRRKDVYR